MRRGPTTEGCQVHGPDPVSEVIELRRPGGDTLWAVIAWVGRVNRIAEVYPDREAALADRAWREQQVRAHAGFLRTCRQPAPSYRVAPIRRSDLPRAWKPLPALGFLRGRFI